jgi:hypothetical protein
MGTFVGILLVTIAAVTVGVVLYMVMTEKHEHQEHFIPPTQTTREDTAANAADPS